MELKSYLAGTQARILAKVESLAQSEAEAATTGAWSIDEILEHLAITERGILVMSKRALRQQVAGEAELAETAGKLELIGERVAKRVSRIEAPPRVRPTGSLGIWPASLTAFLESRAKMIEMAEQVSEEHDRRTLEHPVLGKMTLRQWLWFTAAHSERHAAQIEDQLSGSDDLGPRI